ncbi:DUF6612 family protein [Paenibacillus lemnae]|uniref:LppX_LprAFG lipoprotein n=1 Tax=Paenibacillus lemnae TaxID=1330551 RepID=A0A848M2H3_PAELE|nr:DUF6612 family protein [Paenibacillus lemnae]NMO95188.1 hypothetical protein [Paenibacillus lemnae]
MKKWTTGLLSVILVMGMTACSSDNEPEDAGSTTPPATEQPAENGGTETETPAVETPAEDETAAVPTVDELIQKSAEASQEMKSFTMKSDIKQDITMGEEAQNISIQMTADTTVDPMEMYQEMTMDMAGQGSQDIKQYITQDGVYSEVEGQWYKLPEAEAKQIMDSMAMTSQGPEQQLEQFKSIAEETEVTEDGDNFVLTADVSGDSLKELAKTYMSQTGGTDEQTAAMLEQMDIKSMKIVYGVNKETYLPTMSNVDMVMEMTEGEQTVQLDMKMTSDFTKHNEIDKIEIPQDVVDNAQSMDGAAQ